MNVWTVTSGIIMMILAGLGVYLAIPASSAPTPTEHTITAPGDADKVGLCLPAVKGTGQIPRNGSLWLVVHRVGNRGYYLARQVEPDASGTGWVAGSIQIGNSDSREGQQYELILWSLDAKVTDIVNHVFTAEGLPVFVGPPQGVTTMAHTTVLRTADKQAC
jgi:hypothetical protein